MLIVTRKLHFSAAHRLYNPKFTDQKNKEIFQACENMHGHNYIVEVSLTGTPEKETGYLIDLKILKTLIEDLIVNPCDHKVLNHQVDFLEHIIPTVENLAECFFKRLLPEIKKISKAKLYSLKLYETERNWAEYRED